MPHSTVSTRDKQGRKVCPYCGYPIPSNRYACPAHRDLIDLEQLDDRATLTEDDDE